MDSSFEVIVKRMSKKFLSSVASYVTASCVAGVSLIAVLARSAAADDNKGRVEVGAQIGGMLFQGDAKYDPGHLFGGARVGYGLGQSLSAELGILAGSADVRGNSKDADLILPTLEAAYEFCDGALCPFVAGGFGVLAADGPKGANNGEIVFPIGGGVKYFITDDLAARADARYMLNTEGGDEQHMGYYTGGISWFFGGEKKVASAAKAAPAEPIRQVKEEPFAEEGRILERDKKVSIDLRVQFDFDQTEIKSQYVARLREFAAFMKAHPGTVAEIEGHTDGKGTAKYNQKLSERRASAVRHWLVNEGGIAAGRLVAAGYGLSRPVASNKTDEGRALNRRVIGTVKKTK